MKQKTLATKIFGYIFILFGTFSLFVTFISIDGWKGEVTNNNLGLFAIALAIIIATGGWMISDYKNNNSNS